MTEDIVLIEENEDKTITTIKMNRLAKKNALNFELFTALEAAIDKVEQSRTRVVIITGGENSFSAGIDLKMLTGQDPAAQGKMPNVASPPNFRYWLNTFLQPILTKIEQMEKPVIAKINGYCLGSGFEIALACDFRFAVESATMDLRETRVGIISDVGGVARIVRLVGIPRAKDILLTGRTFVAKEADRMGLLQGIAKDQAELDQMVLSYAEELKKAGPLAVGIGKRLIDACYGKDVHFGMFLEGMANSQLLQSKDFMSAAFARAQKQEPKWKGK
jgi:enoyl-CoA hydratase/carnithine racemase